MKLHEAIDAVLADSRQRGEDQREHARFDALKGGFHIDDYPTAAL
jgi:hypothetical protein